MRVPDGLVREKHRTLGNGVRTVGHRLTRLRRTAAIDRMYRAVLSSWDHDEFVRRFRGYWDPFPTSGPSKYLDLHVWLREAAARYVTLGLFADDVPKRVLDLGCGMGYFLQVCASNGHEVVGLDVDDEPIYNDAIDHFGLPRVVHRIEPFQPLPDLGKAFDVITSFMTTFNFGPEGTTWGEREWMSFLQDIEARLTPRGEVAISFNVDPRTGATYPPGLRRALRTLPAIRARFFGQYLRLSRRGSV